MATNLKIDDSLVNEAKELGGFKTKKETVTRALEEFVRWKRQQGIMELAGTIDFDPDWDYKEQRRRA